MTLRHIFLAATLVAAGTATQAATLVGAGTYATANDLTVINDGGSILEFLDLTVTQGQSVTAATATYGGDGFAVANAAQIAALLDAFDIFYEFNVRQLGVTDAEAAAFVGAVGATVGDAALGTYTEPAAIGPYVYMCIAQTSCSYTGFTQDVDLSAGAPEAGIYLVRAGVSDVPLPAALPMLAVGVFGLTLLRKRRG